MFARSHKNEVIVQVSEKHATDQYGWSYNIPELYLEDYWFESRSGHRLFLLKFSVFLFSPIGQMPG